MCCNSLARLKHEAVSSAIDVSNLFFLHDFLRKAFPSFWQPGRSSSRLAIWMHYFFNSLVPHTTATTVMIFRWQILFTGNYTYHKVAAVLSNSDSTLNPGQEFPVGYSVLKTMLMSIFRPGRKFASKGWLFLILRSDTRSCKAYSLTSTFCRPGTVHS